MKYIFRASVAAFALAALTACAGFDVQTAEGQCHAAQTAVLVAESEGLDEDTQRRAALAVLLACAPEED